LAVVFAERPAPRSSPIRPATSSTPSEDPPPAESRQQVVVEVEAVGLVGAAAALAGRHHRLEALAPARCHGVEAQVRRGRHPPGLKRRDQLPAGAARFAEVAACGAEVEPPGAAGAHRELAVRLAVDAALYAGAASRSLRHRDASEVDLPLTLRPSLTAAVPRVKGNVP